MLDWQLSLSMFQTASKICVRVRTMPGLRIVEADFGSIKAVVDSEQVNAVIDWEKQQEQIEAEQKRAARRKHNREAR